MTPCTGVCVGACGCAVASESDETGRRSRTCLASLLQAWSDGFCHCSTLCVGSVARATLSRRSLLLLVGADLQAAHTGRSRCTAGAISGLATLLDDASGELPARVFPRKLSLLSAAHNFLPLRGLTGWRLAAQEIFLRGRRAQKSMSKSMPAQNRCGSSRWSQKSRRGSRGIHCWGTRPIDPPH